MLVFAVPSFKEITHTTLINIKIIINTVANHLTLQVINLLSGELDLNRANILPDRPEVHADTLAARVHLLRVDPILGVEVLHLPIREDPVELVLDLVLGP